MLTRIACLALTILCCACAILPEHVDVAYSPDPAVSRAAVPGAGDVALVVTDNRHAESNDWVADKKNSYGMRLASVMAQKPVVDLVRDAVAQELTARGFRIVAGGASALSIEITRFEAVYQNRFFSIGAIGNADLVVTVRRTDGTIAFAKTFAASDDKEAALVGTAGDARRTLERTLTKVVGEIGSDPGLLRALSGPARQPIS